MLLATECRAAASGSRPHELHHALSAVAPSAASINDLRKDYVLSGETVHALRGVSFDVPESDYISIMGPSGSGKSTLLNLLGCLDRPTGGSYLLGGEDVARMTDDQRSVTRATRIGFVFQSYNLLPALTVVENIEVPLYYAGQVSAESRERCIDLAKLVGLGDRLDHRPAQLSGGQQQRVAIARSLINDPRFMLADEPTGNLDSATTEEILQLLERLNQEGRTIILVTHENEVAERTKRTIMLRDGKIQFDERRRE
ncbi:MAG TPA: ABC transporter ATP-binding protein [Lacipirellulaceae bacterium]|nr:ABC transporter ATP-binding protein [Lacipirellulaceae bacterium]HMP04754.1 ABC transporter ATP-binding protein [Lacipirellulaceae bacterium]